MGHVILRDVDSCHRQGVSADQKAHPEHAQRRDIANKGDAKGRHRNLEPAPGHPDHEPGNEQQPLPTALIARLDRFRCRDPRWPCARRGKDLGVEHSVEQVGIEQHRQRCADQHRQNQVATAKKKRNTNWYEEAVGRTECCGRNVALCEVLNVNGAVASKERQRDSCQDHRNQRADDRRVRCHPELQNQLDTDNGAEDRENDQQREGCRGECRGVRLIERVVFGFGLDVGHFLLTMRRCAQHGSPVQSNAWSLSALLSSCHPLSDSGRSVQGLAAERANHRRLLVSAIYGLLPISIRRKLLH